MNQEMYKKFKSTGIVTAIEVRRTVFMFVPCINDD